MLRKRYRFRGTVQGVGFRPAISRIASGLGLSGFVQNRSSEVVAEVQGRAEDVERFEAALRTDLPPAARLEQSIAAVVPARPADDGFRILDSARDLFSFPPIPPDLPLCEECAAELLDPANRRYRYPFITCTQCGPRYSIVERTPFDRVNTSMRPFEQCPECAREYADPADRRFHSQTNSCPACGPRLNLLDAAGQPIGGDPLLRAVDVLSRGGIVAIQGIGGFHLAADPVHAGAIQRLRRDKERERKPFALMVRDMEEAETICILSPTERRALLSAESPIVIAARSPDAPARLRTVSDTDTLGIMLPYTPLHMLLFRHPHREPPYRHLVMTSGNRAREPIITDPAEAIRKLSGVADAFLVHDRRIVLRTDDSIVRVGQTSGSCILRRSRGYVPRLIHLHREVEGVILGIGGDLKAAPSLVRGRDVHLCPFIGDLEDLETQTQFERMIEQVLDLYGASPDLIVHDLHPLYHSTRVAAGIVQRRGARLLGLQHHYAHALSVMAEHGLEEAIALCFDGTGYGTDGAIWGGEFLRASRTSFERLGSFAEFRLPGGEAAVLHPSRIAFALLDGDAHDAGSADPARGLEELPGMKAEQIPFLRAMLRKGVNCPLTTSLGRLFDAAAAVLGLVDTVSYEGEGPIRLEGIAAAGWRETGSPRDAGVEETRRLVPFLPSGDVGGLFRIDPRPLLAHLWAQRGRSSAGSLALLFHEAVACAAAEGARRMREQTGIPCCVLGGGVFQNLLLRELLLPLLIKDGFEVFLNERVPPGDGGLSVGQVWHQER